jgi:hypothetical protein
LILFVEDVWKKGTVVSFRDAVSSVTMAMPADLRVRFPIVHAVHVFQADDSSSDIEDDEVADTSPKKRRKTRAKENAAEKRNRTRTTAPPTPVRRTLSS